MCYERTEKIREIGLNLEGRRKEDTERYRHGKGLQSIKNVLKKA